LIIYIIESRPASLSNLTLWLTDNNLTFLGCWYLIENKYNPLARPHFLKPALFFLFIEYNKKVNLILLPGEKDDYR